MPIARSKVAERSRAGRYTSEDIHRALFRKGKPRRRTLEELKAGIRKHVRRQARG